MSEQQTQTTSITAVLLTTLNRKAEVMSALAMLLVGLVLTGCDMTVNLGNNERQGSQASQTVKKDVALGGEGKKTTKLECEAWEIEVPVEDWLPNQEERKDIAVNEWYGTQYSTGFKSTFVAGGRKAVMLLVFHNRADTGFEEAVQEGIRKNTNEGHKLVYRINRQGPYEGEITLLFDCVDTIWLKGAGMTINQRVIQGHKRDVWVIMTVYPKDSDPIPITRVQNSWRLK